MNARRSPIQSSLVLRESSDGDVLRHPTSLVKLGLKGPGLNDWRQAHGLDLPLSLHEALLLDDNGVVVRCDRNEVILESLPDAPLRTKVTRALEAPHPNLFQVEQQSATFMLCGDTALSVLAQTCSFNFRDAEPWRIVFTRVAGVSCGVIPEIRGVELMYRVWVDYSYAHYLWKQLSQIIGEMTTR